MIATIDSADAPGIIEVEFIRVHADEREARAVLQALEHDARALTAVPGFLGASLHVSDDGTVIAWRRWAGDASRRASRAGAGSAVPGEQVLRLGRRDLAAYEAVYVHTTSGRPLVTERDGGATLIDVMVTDPARQQTTLEFNAVNARAFAAQPGYRSTAVLRGRDGTRAVTYSQWDMVEDWLAAVKTTAGEMLPGLRTVETIRDLNAVLQEASRAMGSMPEYHAYRVAAVIEG